MFFWNILGATNHFMNVLIYCDTLWVVATILTINIPIKRITNRLLENCLLGASDFYFISVNDTVLRQSEELVISKISASLQFAALPKLDTWTAKLQQSEVTYSHPCQISKMGCFWNQLRLKAVSCFLKTLYLRCLTGFCIRLWFCSY